MQVELKESNVDTTAVGVANLVQIKVRVPKWLGNTQSKDKVTLEAESGKMTKPLDSGVHQET